MNPGSTHGKADGDFAAARDRADQEQIRDIGAGEEEQNSSEAEEHGENLVQIAVNSEGRTPERVEANFVRAIAVFVGKALGNILHEYIEFGLSLRVCDTGAKPAENV